MRTITEGIHWIQELGPARPSLLTAARARAVSAGSGWSERGTQVHLPQNAYLLTGERTLLLDTLSPAAKDQVVPALESALGGRALDFLVISHPDIPHAGNTARILRRYPECVLVAPRYGDLHELYHLEDARKVGEGDSIDLGGRVVDFHEATLLDAPLHLWMSERTTSTLFCVDWMGMPIFAEETERFLDELVEGGDSGEDLLDRYYDFHARVMFWFQYVDADRVAVAMQRVHERFQPQYLAPAHGPVVRPADGGPSIADVFALNEAAMRKVRRTGRIGVL